MYDDETAHARRTDPQTSHDAARKVDLTKGELWVLKCLNEIGYPVTDVELVTMYQEAWRRNPEGIMRQADSGLRTRRKGLVTKGKVKAVGKKKLPSGNDATVWAVRQ